MHRTKNCQLRLKFRSERDPVEAQLPTDRKKRCRDLLAEMMKKLVEHAKKEGKGNE